SSHVATLLEPRRRRERVSSRDGFVSTKYGRVIRRCVFPVEVGKWTEVDRLVRPLDGVRDRTLRPSRLSDLAGSGRGIHRLPLRHLGLDVGDPTEREPVLVELEAVDVTPEGVLVRVQ